MNIYMKPETEWKLRAYSKKIGVPMARIVDEILNNLFETVNDKEQDDQTAESDTM